MSIEMAMTIDEFAECSRDVQLTTEQLLAARFLERNGLRFRIDFGYSNAPAMAWRMIDPDGPLFLDLPPNLF